MTALAVFTTGWVLAHPVTLLVFGGLAVLLVAGTAVAWRLMDDGQHKAPRRRPAGGAARAWRRALGSMRRLPGAVRGWFASELDGLADWPADPETTMRIIGEIHHELAPGAGASSFHPVTTASCPGAEGSLKADSPAPEHVPSAMPAPAPADGDGPGPAGRASDHAPAGPGTTILWAPARRVPPAEAAIRRAEAAGDQLAALQEEIRATRPWADDTGSFEAICADVMGAV